MKMLSESRAYPLAFCGLAEGAADKIQVDCHTKTKQEDIATIK